MSRLQDLVVQAIERDEDVTGTVSVIGVSNLNRKPNGGHLGIRLRPRGERPASVGDIIDRLHHAIEAIPGMIVYLQPIQDIQISARSSRAQYQYTLTGTDARAVADWSAKLAERLRSERSRSEEHTSELQSRQYLVCRLLLEKKNKQTKRACCCLSTI